MRHLGLDDDAIEALVLGPILLDEIQRLRDASGCLIARRNRMQTSGRISLRRTEQHQRQNRAVMASDASSPSVSRHIRALRDETGARHNARRAGR